MDLLLADILRCPYSGAPLEGSGSEFAAPSGHRYQVHDGIPHLLDAARLSALDQQFQEQYGEENAGMYDKAIRRMSLLAFTTEARERRRLAALLGARPGARILEVSVGTGANLPYLAEQVGPQGDIVALDLSVPMMNQARAKARTLTTPVHFVRGDGCHLPFADASFDAVFHYGGIGMFGDIRRGLAEMIRVARPGAPLVVSDEGMSETLRRNWLGGKLAGMNGLFLCRPPFAAMPWEQVEGFELHWAWRQVFWVFRFRKAGTTDQAPAGDPEAEIRRRMGRA